MQELLVRGYLYQMIKAKHNIIAATIISTALFTFMHGGAFGSWNNSSIKCLNHEPLMTIVLEYTHTPLTPILMHFCGIVCRAIILAVYL